MDISQEINVDLDKDGIAYSSQPANFPKRILVFISLFLLVASLALITILSSGAAAGIFLPGAAGFLGAISSITGLGVGALASLPGFTALTAIAMGSTALLIGSVLGIFFNLSENFLGLPKFFEEKISDLNSYQKKVGCILLILLGLSLICIAGWAMTSTLTIAIGMGNFLGSFLNTASGVALLLGLTTFTLSGAGASYVTSAYLLEKSIEEIGVDNSKYSPIYSDSHTFEKGSNHDSNCLDLRPPPT